MKKEFTWDYPLFQHVQYKTILYRFSLLDCMSNFQVSNLNSSSTSFTNKIDTLVYQEHRKEVAGKVGTIPNCIFQLHENIINQI
jgi:hypothetical protein